MAFLFLALATPPAPEDHTVACPVNETTTLVFPEPLKRLRSQAHENRLFGLTVTRTRPLGVITVRPTTPGAHVTIEFRGTTRVIRVRLEAAAEGRGTEVQVGQPPPPTAPPVVGPSLPPVPVPSPTPVASPAPSPVPSPALDLQGLLRATPHEIGRREGLPGQPPLVLKDALRGEEFVWLRFLLEGGAAARVEKVSWEGGDIDTFLQEPSGKDLRIVVQVPRARVTKKTRVSLRLDTGATYRFPLTPSTLTSFFKELFK